MELVQYLFLGNSSIECSIYVFVFQVQNPVQVESLPEGVSLGADGNYPILHQRQMINTYSLTEQ